MRRPRLHLAAALLWLCLCQLASVAHSLSAEGLPPSSKGHASVGDASKSTATSAEAAAVARVVAEARRLGPVANDRSEREKEEFLNLSRGLRAYYPSEKTGRPAAALGDYSGGVWERMYSVSPGKKKGRIRQTFKSPTSLVNSVQMGPLKVSLSATLSPATDGDGMTCDIQFQRMWYKLFGIPFYWKRMKGGIGGSWKYLYEGEFVDIDGRRRQLRVMETPSLFLLVKDLE